MGVFTSEMKDDKKKMIEDAVAELKNAGGDAPAASAAPAKAASPVKPKAEPKKAAPPSKVSFGYRLKIDNFFSFLETSGKSSTSEKRRQKSFEKRRIKIG